MSLDNSAATSESSGPLDTSQAAEAFTNFFDAPAEPVKEETPTVDTELDTPQPVEQEAEAPTEAEASAEESTPITVKIDGKDVVLTPEQIAEAYKGQLRQDDYTRKTMQAAEARKAADAEVAKAQQERQAASAQLAQNANLLQAVLQEQGQTDWQALLKSDPVAYLEQRHLFEQRQAALQQTLQQKSQMDELTKAEQAQAYQRYMQEQQQELVAKLPTWKDAAKAKAETEALKSYLKGEGYDDQSIAGISDHRLSLIHI